MRLPPRDSTSSLAPAGSAAPASAVAVRTVAATRPLVLRRTAAFRATSALVIGAGFAVMFAGCAPNAAPNEAGTPDQVIAGEPGPEARATQAAVAAIPVADRCEEEMLSALGTLHDAYPTDSTLFALVVETFDRCQAYEDLTAAYERRPDEVRGDVERRELARVYLRHAGRFEDALAIVAPLAEATPGDADLAGITAASLYYLGRVEEVSPYLDGVWNQLVASGNVELMTMRAEAYVKQGNTARARRIYEQILEQSPNYPFALTSYGQWLVEQGDAESLAYGDRLLRRSESINAVRDREAASGSRINDLSKAMMKAWEAQDYEQTLQIALQLQPILPDDKQPDIYRTLGHTYTELGRNDEARDAYTRAAEIETELAAKQIESSTP